MIMLTANDIIYFDVASDKNTNMIQTGMGSFEPKPWELLVPFLWV